MYSAPFSPTTASTGHIRAMWSHQPAGRPVTGMTHFPAARKRSIAPYASAVIRPWEDSVSSMSVNTPRIATRVASGIFVNGCIRRGSRLRRGVQQPLGNFGRLPRRQRGVDFFDAVDSHKHRAMLGLQQPVLDPP